MSKSSAIAITIAICLGAGGLGTAAFNTLVTIPNIEGIAPEEVYAKYYVNYDYEVPTGSWNKVELNAGSGNGVVFNANDFSISILTRGYYSIVGCVKVVNPLVDEIYLAGIRVNDIEKSVGEVHSSNTYPISAITADMLLLDVGDEVSLYFYYRLTYGPVEIQGISAGTLTYLTLLLVNEVA